VKCGRAQEEEREAGSAPEVASAPEPEPEPEPAPPATPPQKTRHQLKSVDVRCPKCRHEFRRPLGLVGRREKCPECRFVFVVPPPPTALISEEKKSSGTIPNEQDVPQAAQAQTDAPEVVPEVIAKDESWSAVEDSPASGQTTGVQVSEDKAPGFAKTQTANPVEATDILFESALPATPSSTPEQLEEGFNRIGKLWGSKKLHDGSREQIRELILANLQRVCSREVVDEIGIEVIAEQRAVQVSVRLKHIGFVQVRVWHIEDQFFACGNGCFE